MRDIEIVSGTAEEVSELIREASDAGVHIIAETEPMECSDCGEEKELRPYGKGGAYVCFSCMMKDEEEGVKQLGMVMDGNQHKAGSA